MDHSAKLRSTIYADFTDLSTDYMHHLAYYMDPWPISRMDPSTDIMDPSTDFINTSTNFTDTSVNFMDESVDFMESLPNFMYALADFMDLFAELTDYLSDFMILLNFMNRSADLIYIPVNLSFQNYINIPQSC